MSSSQSNTQVPTQSPTESPTLSTTAPPTARPAGVTAPRPARADVPVDTTWNLSDLFADTDAWAAACQQVDEARGQLAALRAQIVDGPSLCRAGAARPLGRPC